MFSSEWHVPRVLQWSLLLLATTGLLWSADRGFDLTDESYYVFAIFSPNVFDANIHPFGLLLHPISSALDNSLPALRRMNILFVCVCGIIWGAYIDRYYRAAVGHRIGGSVPALGGLFMLTHFAVVWILTPGYNGLANAGGVLVMSGALGWAAFDYRPTSRLRDDMSSLLVGFGGMIAFFAKPTFAGIAAAAIVVQLVIVWRARGLATVVRRSTVAAVACLVPLVSIVAGTIGLGRFVETFRAGAATLDFGNGLASLPGKFASDILHAPIPVLLACGVFAGASVWFVHRRPDTHSPLAVLVALTASGVALISLGRAVLRAFRHGMMSLFAHQMLTFVLVIATTGLVVAAARFRRPRVWIPIYVLIALPFAIAFGTANDSVYQTALSMFALLLTVCLVADLCFPRIASVTVSLSLATLSTALLICASRTPYGLPAPLWEQTIPFRFPSSNASVLLDPKTHSYVTGLREIATERSLAPETPIIDLTGNGPGTALMLNGNAPYFPWIVGIFPGSARLAATIWSSLTSEQKDAAWFVLPPHPTFARSEMMARLGSERAGYEIVGRLKMRFGGTDSNIEIWAPRRKS